MPWSLANIPAQQGRRVLVTGGASGIGLGVAEAMAARGAAVTLLDRDQAAAERAAARIRTLIPDAQVRAVAVDLLDLDAVRQFAERHAEQGALDVLFNIAGILSPPQRRLSPGGQELGFAISVLGHHALTAQLLPALLRAAAPRVVGISSVTHAYGQINFDDLSLSAHYESTSAYAQAKLAALVWALQLDRMARAAGSKLCSVAAHPGVAKTAIGNQHLSGNPGLRARAEHRIMTLLTRWMGQDANAGAEPLLRAGTDPDAEGGSYWGPDGFMEFRGPPAPGRVAARARDAAVGERLWQVCEQLTGVPLRL